MATLWAQSNQELSRQGIEAYNQGRYDQAIEQWEQVLAQGQECGELYYNLGNAYFRTEQWGRCLLCYERARRLMPQDRDLRENLELAYAKTQDHQTEIPKIFFVRWWNNLIMSLSAHGWMNLTIVIAMLLGACIVVFCLAHDYQLRKWTLVGNFVLGAVLLLVLVCTLSMGQKTTQHNDAIIQEPVSIVKSAPDSKSVDKFVLHEGTKVHIEEESGSWIRIRIGDGNSGWMAMQEVEII